MEGVDNRKDVILLLLALPGGDGKPNEPISGRTRMMKLLYLLDRQIDIRSRLPLKSYYSFEPYHYGPFSKDVYDDIEFLRNVRLLEYSPEGPASIAQEEEGSKLLDDESLDEGADALGGAAIGSLTEERFELTAKGKEFVQKRLIPSISRSDLEAISRVKSEFGGLTLSSLLGYVYSKYPESATNSRLRRAT